MSISRWNKGSGARSPDRSEAVLRGLAILLGMAFLVGVAACGGDESGAKAAVAMEPVVTRSVPVVSEGDQPEDPSPDPASQTEVESAPITRAVSYEEAESAYHDGAYGLAVDLFEAYTNQRPENPWGQYMLGLSAWKAGHLDLAELALTESVALSPNHVKGRVNLARVLLEAGRPQEALEHARHAEDVDPTSVQAKRTLARALESSGDVDGALAMYEEALWIAPEDAWS
ncbi:MAG: tetratricopeptide repeat protein, partial [Gemmatimonadota bacterium]|nr:tetratricopeptide repeat protein [Gemmatimonadota bacterium]